MPFLAFLQSSFNLTFASAQLFSRPVTQNEVLQKMAESTGLNIISSLVTLGAVALGWLLGETTGWFKSKKRITVLKKALFEEIQDASSWLRRNQLTLEEIIQLSTIEYLSEVSPVSVPVHIYDKHFPEISVYLSRSERISYNSIYNLINISYDQIKKIRALRSACLSDKTKIKEYLETLDAAYYNISMAIWQINRHINYGSQINVDNLSGEDAKVIDDEIKEKLIKITNEAKTLSVSEIEKNYYKT